jgi:hypothetical protein
MGNKICTKCERSKPLLYFSKRNDRKSGYASLCRTCVYLLGREYKRTRKGLLTEIYSQQVSNSKKRKHDKPEYTVEVFIQAILTSDKFEELYCIWLESKYKKELKPSIDRIDDKKGYSLSNIQIMTWGENNKKGNESQRSGSLDTSIPHKKVAQYTLNDVFVKEFVSVREAGRETDILPQSISKVCNGKRTKAGGFKWKHV